ncbi:hypothetical protein GCM10010921_21040 [Microbacterium album]|uniref:D,D-heptose 1,7-bisphosphate phosphatase n=1 Tax=Microbacterium album TaxID=2053191 RepID=A0A917IFU2_9MICO|nr:hypothetical protein GCM10010921_21040 [Microbacterium album]
MRAVLFDRDGTLVIDVPYNGDPDLVRPVPTAARAVARLRCAGLPLGVVSNQSGIGRGLIVQADAEAVNARVDTLLGPFDVWRYCPHVPEDRCACRKPAPGLVLSACAALGVSPSETVVIGDIAADVDAAARAGARAVLVPTPATRAEEIVAAPQVAEDLAAAVDWVLQRVPDRAGAGDRDPGSMP